MEVKWSLRIVQQLGCKASSNLNRMLNGNWSKIMTNAIDIERAVSEGLKTLWSRCRTYDVSVADLERWFRADTPYPDIGIEDVNLNPLLVVHEIVEIDEIRMMGLDMDKKGVHHFESGTRGQSSSQGGTNRDRDRLYDEESSAPCGKGA